MDSILCVERELSSVSDKFRQYLAANNATVGQIRSQLEALKEQISEDVGTTETLEDGTTVDRLSTIGAANIATMNVVRDALAKTVSDHREFHSSVSKVGKSIDRNFTSDFDATALADIFAGSEEQRMLNQVILQHFYRQGQLEIASELSREARLPDVDSQNKAQFLELNSIIEALAAKKLQPALDWAVKNRAALKEHARTTTISRTGGAQTVTRQSSLEMKLHKLQFVEMLREGKTTEAVKYSRFYFPHFVDTNEKEIQSLMGALIYANHPGGLEKSPYAHLLDKTHWQEICHIFLKDACMLMGLSVESPLSVIVNAGCKALPALLNIKSVMQQRQVSGVWSSKDELPIEIDLGPEARYHSIFACPILRQQTSDDNPPLKLACGHCISRDALGKLSTSLKMKCPYCPVEQNPQDAKRIYF